MMSDSRAVSTAALVKEVSSLISKMWLGGIPFGTVATTGWDPLSRQEEGRWAVSPSAW
jgi:hypothetical protein